MYITTCNPAVCLQITTTVFTSRHVIPPFKSCTVQTALLALYSDDEVHGEMNKTRDTEHSAILYTTGTATKALCTARRK